ncbi:hypothetical protein EV643_11114 [Kribbella sp. VKM Ac-2527]|uniref:Uncharacterized protein n=1 Tax=Kribbella caucasensis TaxID=2512215 RepID=A0A4R6K8Q4_9ACTN|nr:hypothetical protein [Kribbella sp. VKM Ac-2527]TDO46162.1 hypothetical protein EV643_11114 [Kribbella sp. VKM Ac-2527]
MSGGGPLVRQHGRHGNRRTPAPIGTQVVLRVARPDGDGGTAQRGAIGRVRGVTAAGRYEVRPLLELPEAPGYLPDLMAVKAEAEHGGFKGPDDGQLEP